MNNNIFRAVEDNNLDLVKSFNLSDFNKIDSNGDTPLHLACFWNHLPVVKYLVEHGANINATNRGTGQQPLYEACKHGFEITLYLIEHGANVNHIDKFGMTPLHSAAMNGNLKTVKCLVEHGALLVPNRQGKTPFDLAIKELDEIDEMTQDDRDEENITEETIQNYMEIISYLEHERNKQNWKRALPKAKKSARLINTRMVYLRENKNLPPNVADQIARLSVEFGKRKKNPSLSSINKIIFYLKKLK